jgi:TPR repeat protein
MLYKGLGINKDMGNAIIWFEKSANQGNVDAKNLLGTFYLKGIGVPKSTDRGLELIISAATEGHPAAFHNLGLVYQLGLGVPRNNIYAYLWFAVATKSGHQSAKRFREGAALSMTPDAINTARALASACERKNFKMCISF